MSLEKRMLRSQTSGRTGADVRGTGRVTGERNGMVGAPRWTAGRLATRDNR